MRAAEETGTDPWILAAAASVALSWTMFFLARDRERGLFVGLWAPTILAFASYFRQTRMHDTVERAMGQEGLVGRIEGMVQGR
jgi:hypothetical protein